MGLKLHIAGPKLQQIHNDSERNTKGQKGLLF